MYPNFLDLYIEEQDAEESAQRHILALLKYAEDQKWGIELSLKTMSYTFETSSPHKRDDYNLKRYNTRHPDNPPIIIKPASYKETPNG